MNDPPDLESPVLDPPPGMEQFLDHQYLSEPLHVQRVEQALQLNPLLEYVDTVLQENVQVNDMNDTDTDTGTEDADGMNGFDPSRSDRRVDKSRAYNFSKVKKNRRWLKNILLSDSSTDEEDNPDSENDRLKEMLKMHQLQQQYRSEFEDSSENRQFQYYSVGLLSSTDKFPQHQKSIIGPKKGSKDQRRMEKKKKKRIRLMKQDQGLELESKLLENNEAGTSGKVAKKPKIKKITAEQLAAKRKRLWISMVRKDVPRGLKHKNSARKEHSLLLKKVNKECQRECRRAAIASQRVARDAPMRARRLCREMLAYWRQFEKVEKQSRKKAEREAQEQRKMDVEIQEARRQQRKLNFLITQTELYAHFMAKKLQPISSDVEEDSGDETDDDPGADEILARLSEATRDSCKKTSDGGQLVSHLSDEYDGDHAKTQCLMNVQNAYEKHEAKKIEFDDAFPRQCVDLSQPVLSTNNIEPLIFNGKLKAYQMKGMNWLIDLYNQGINGILADEMGLGKTVQSISFLAHLAETQGIWGPFLVIAPSSTLHHWQQEVTRFVPKFKVVPYWGNAQERKVLRNFWNHDNLHTESASFHVVITSYQLLIQDVKYLQRIDWHYMVLDEAQALKSSSSVRWKMLLGFKCRNRLLLTGTPIQNSMAELWALLHFIMPTLFDSHDEFNEWFSKDIESSVENQSSVDPNQLSRLHMILKPFMLRRVKKDVENELSDKIEIMVYCPLTQRQKLLYQGIKNRISIEDLLLTAQSSTSQAQTSSLMNLVMQFRKVCNHPELFERREISGPFGFVLDPYAIPKLVYREMLLESFPVHLQRLIFNTFSVHNAAHIHHSLKSKGKFESCIFSFLRFINLSPSQLQSIMLLGLLARWSTLMVQLQEAYRLQQQVLWNDDLRPINTRCLQSNSLIISPLFPASNLSSPFVFSNACSSVYAHVDVVLHSMPETALHRRIRHRNSAKLLASAEGKNFLAKEGKIIANESNGEMDSEENSKDLIMDKELMDEKEEQQPESIFPYIERKPQVLVCQPMEMPYFLQERNPKVISAPLTWFCADRSAEWERRKGEQCGSLEARSSLLYGSPEMEEIVMQNSCRLHPIQPCGLLAVQPKHGFSGIHVPSKETLVTDAGKLHVLDSLLKKMKRENHRVLIYSQMTRMIDLLEEFMWLRRHTCIRLDGSSKIAERRDLVANFQARSDIFVFLLSTRAGGLGINLTAADTVIFYDSDWNPTVDQQAMDRAHRLGQTKQVTVYRLICKDTIEERILDRAKEKSEIQRMVISGGQFKSESLKHKEVVSMLLDDVEMEKRIRNKQAERRLRESQYREKQRWKREHQQPSDHNLPQSEVVLQPKRARGRPRKIRGPMPTPAMVRTDDPEQWSNPSNASSPTPSEDATDSTPPAAGVQIVGRRPRGRPRGSGGGRGSRRGRGRGSIRKAMSAAAIAGSQAGKASGYAAYGYDYLGGDTS